MKLRNLKKVFVFISVATLAIASVGCGTKSSSVNTSGEATTSTTAENASSEDTATSTGEGSNTEEVRTVTIGIGNSFNPMCYVDENGKLQGYDYETLKKIDELLPQYEFKYEATEFKNILVGLDTKSYDIAVHHYGWNKERGEKYLYANVGNFYGTGYDLMIAKGSKVVVNSVDDLAGLKIAVATSSNVAYLTETYNKEHPDKQIKIIYDDGTTEQQLASLNNGVYDGILGTSFGDSLNKKAYGDIFDVTGSELFYDASQANGCYFIYNYGDEQLRDDLDGALQQLLDSGWEKELSLKLLGADYTIDLSKSK